MPADGPLEILLPDDALTVDGAVTLLPAPPQHTKVVMLEGLDPALVKTLQRGLSVVPGVDFSPAVEADAMTWGPAGSIASVTVGAAGPLKSYLGPFFAQKGNPVLEDVQLSGAIWTAGANPPGLPLMSAGEAVLVSEEEDGRVHLNLDLARSNVQRTVAWPVLVSNLVRRARVMQPGFPRHQLMLGEEIPVTTAPGARYVLQGPKGVERPVLGVGPVTLPAAASPGEWKLLREGKPTDALVVLPLDPRESDLRTRGPYEVKAAATEGVALTRAAAPAFVLAAAAAVGVAARRLLAHGQNRCARMTLLFPQALLLLVPLALLLWRTAKLPGPAFPLRVVLVIVLVLALSRPELTWRSAGSDLIVIADRSKSMPARSEATLEELIHLLEHERKPADRIGVISFGRQARFEMPLSGSATFGGFTAELDAEASNLSLALDAASDAVPVDRAARVLVLSDGRATGLDARAAARRLAARGIPVDYRWVGREDSGLDVAVTSLSGPASVASKEPFQLTATVHSTGAAKVRITLARQGKVLTRGDREIPAGRSTLTFGDLVDAPGLYAYQLQVEAPNDSVIENDVGRAVVRVEGPPRVLVLTDKPNGTLATTLKAAGIDTSVRPPLALSLDALDDVGAVVLEDIEASRLSESGLHVLSQYVREAGGGLVMTGGKHSFGEGGYRKSPVEDLLPVSLEVREEQRRVAIAMSVIMDCSCSMGARVPDGRTKMELAAEGVVGALELLNPHDEASVHMIDTGDHEIFGLSPVGDGLPLGKVARGFTGGGGIYIGVGLRVGKDEILSSRKATRHVLLFADAADSEEPDDYRATLKKLTAENVTVSVIGMGKPTDSDAKLLEEIAALGNGRIYFAEDVTSLPRIFSQETIAVARASFVDSATPLALGPDLALLGRMPTSAPAPCGGYNLTYLKPQASVGLRTDDENAAPALSFSWAARQRAGPPR